jgi:hypothetical protein
MAHHCLLALARSMSGSIFEEELTCGNHLQQWVCVVLVLLTSSPPPAQLMRGYLREMLVKYTQKREVPTPLRSSNVSSDLLKIDRGQRLSSSYDALASQFKKSNKQITYG